MIVRSTTHNPYTTVQRSSENPCQLRKFFSPIRNNVIDFMQKKPLIAGSALLTISAFLASFFSNRALALLPIVGIPAISLFGLEIFSDMKDSVKKRKCD